MQARWLAPAAIAAIVVAPAMLPTFYVTLFGYVGLGALVALNDGTVAFAAASSGVVVCTGSGRPRTCCAPVPSLTRRRRSSRARSRG